MWEALAASVTSRVGRWVVVLGWIAMATTVSIVAPMLSDVSSSRQEDFLPTGAESTLVAEMLETNFPSAGTAGILVYSNEGGLTRSDLDEIRRVEAWLGAPEREFVVSVFSQFSAPESAAGFVSDDQTTSLVLFSLVDPGGVEALQERIREIREVAGEGSGDLNVWLTGPAGILDDAVSVFQSIDLRITLITVALVLVILLAIYRAPILALLPLVSVSLAYVTASGVVALLAEEADLLVNAQATSIMVVVLFGAGTDYMLFISARLKEELRRTDSTRVALIRTMSNVGPAIFSSASTTVVAMLALTLATLGSFRILGPILALGMVFAILAGLTFIPATLSLLGRKAYWPASPVASAGAGRSGVWGGIANAVARRPLFIVLSSVVLLGAMSLGTLTIRPTYDLLNSLPAHTSSVEGFRALEDAFPAGSLAPTDGLMETKGRMDESLSALEDLAVAWAELPGVARVSGPLTPFGAPLPLGANALQDLVTALPIDARTAVLSGDLVGLSEALRELPLSADEQLAIAGYAAGRRYVSASGEVARLEIVFDLDPNSIEAFDLVAEMRQTADSIAASHPEVNEVLVGGLTATQLDTRNATNRDILVIAPVVFGAIFVILLLLVRAVVAPLYLLGSVALSFFASLGVSVLIFQGLLGHAGIGSSVPIFMFIFLVALGIDYNIYIIARVREEVRIHGLREGTLRAVSRTGGVITSAGVILAGTFTALMSLPLLDLFQLGFVVALGVLLDTFLVRGVIVPAFVLLLGRWNWWPGSPMPPRG